MKLDYTARDAFAVTPSDATQIRASSLYIGGAGAVAVVTEAGTSVIFAAVPVGTVLNISVQKVLATGTTATLILGLL
jgi:hypothetical protein